MKSRTDFTTLCMILLAVAASCLINACTEKNELTPKNSFRTADKIYYERLFQDPEFKARAKERWNKFLPRFREIPDFIEAEAERIKSSESMNYAIWPVTKDVNKDISLTFEGAVDKMKKSYSDKLEWMDAEIASW